MLTHLQTEQLVQDVQQAFPMLVVNRSMYPMTGEHVVIVQDPKSQNEVRITSARTKWHAQVAAMDASSRL